MTTSNSSEIPFEEKFPPATIPTEFLSVRGVAPHPDAIYFHENGKPRSLEEIQAEAERDARLNSHPVVRFLVEKFYKKP